MDIAAIHKECWPVVWLDWPERTGLRTCHYNGYTVRLGNLPLPESGAALTLLKIAGIIDRYQWYVSKA